jgi:hypothetical protein
MDFDNYDAAVAFALLLEPMMIEEMPKKPSLTIAEKLEADKAFCDYLTDRFVKENREAGITEPQSEALLAQFKDIMSMAQVGAVPSVYALLQNVTVGEIYTQARKDKDLADLQNYMNS